MYTLIAPSSVTDRTRMPTPLEKTQQNHESTRKPAGPSGPGGRGRETTQPRGRGEPEPRQNTPERNRTPEHGRKKSERTGTTKKTRAASKGSPGRNQPSHAGRKARFTKPSEGGPCARANHARTNQPKALVMFKSDRTFAWAQISCFRHGAYDAL